MTTANDKEVSLARIYSGAMLELAQRIGEAETLLRELGELCTYLDENPDLERFFSSPTVESTSRGEAIERWFRGRTSDLLVDSLQILNRKERLGLLRTIAEAYRLDHEELCGQIDVHVRSAVPLPDAMRDRLTQVTTALAGKEARLVEQVDDSVIGGLVVLIGDRKLDTSVAARLKKLGVAFSDRASREIHGGTDSYVVQGSG